MRRRLEARGVRFERVHIESLENLKDRKHDILINACGAQARNLKDVADSSLVPYQLQSIIANMSYRECYIYRGNNGYYFNMFGRGDGTTCIGGIKVLGSSDRSVYDIERRTVCLRSVLMSFKSWTNMDADSSTWTRASTFCFAISQPQRL